MSPMLMAGCGLLFFVFLVLSIVIIGVVVYMRSKKKGVNFKDGVSGDEFSLIKDAFEETVSVESIDASIEKLRKIIASANTAIAKLEKEKQEKVAPK